VRQFFTAIRVNNQIDGAPSAYSTGSTVLAISTSLRAGAIRIGEGAKLDEFHAALCTALSPPFH
jgi:hypothetical protein